MTQEAHLPSDHTPTPAAPAPNLLLLVVSGVAVVGQLALIVPRFERLIGRMKMPLLTEWLIHESRWAVPAITIAAFLVCIGLGRRSPWPWLFLLFLLPLAINVLVGVSLYFPYMQLLESFSGGNKK